MVYRRIKKYFAEKLIAGRLKGKTKIFCIGCNKTGTTSLKRAFKDLGYIVGDQRRAERLMRSYFAGDFKPFTKYCRTAQVFQDAPFSFPGTYKHVDKAFPGSKFILTVRDSPEQWYNSLVTFHGKKFGKGNIPTAEDLKNSNYIWKGFMWECNRAVYNSPEDDPYKKDILIDHYNKYNEGIREYFKDRLDDLIVINISENGAYQKLMQFLSINSRFTDFPWENKTENIKTEH